MELSLAFLAAFADVSRDNNLHAFSIDFNKVACPGFPAVVQVAIVAKITGTPDEAGTHRFCVRIVKPDGSPVEGPTLDFELPPQVDAIPAPAITIFRVGVAVDMEGVFGFVLSIDDRELKTLPILVIGTGSPTTEV